MPRGRGGIATRQNTANLYSTSKALGAGVSAVSPSFGVAGYAQAIFSIFADQPFDLMFEEANDLEGPWTNILSVNASPSGPLYRIGMRTRPVGAFMRVTIQNSGVAQKFLSAMVYGLPL